MMGLVVPPGDAADRPGPPQAGEGAERCAIARLIPHQGAMCLLAAVAGWDAGWIDCRAVSHLAADNPLRRDGRLGVLAGIEYAMQATALHGALVAGGVAQAAAYLAVLRDLTFGAAAQLDDPGLGTLRVQAWLERRETTGAIYRFAVASAAGERLVAGRAVIAMGA